MDDLLEEFLINNDDRLIGLADCLLTSSDWGKEKEFKQITMDLNFIFISNNKESDNGNFK